jgi:mannose-6-phosphate isomerase-like protein (cupin superfamily)
MADYTASRIDDLPELWDGFARLVRKGLGLSSFGANVMDMPGDYTTGPHDEGDSGQEELYVVLRGSAWVLVGAGDDSEQALEIDADHIVRVGPGERRRLRSGPEGCRVLIVGGTPGKAYEPQDWSS